MEIAVVAAEPSFVETLTAWSTAGAAIVAAASAAFIAWQIRLTRKSVKATEDALALAKREYEHGQVLRVDAQRAYIDAEMPRLTVEIPAQVRAAARTDLTQVDQRTKKSIPVDVHIGEEFITPRDIGIPLLVGFWVAITNDGPRRARVRVDQPSGSEEIVVLVGATKSVMIEREQPVGEWIEIAECRLRDESEERTLATITYVHPGDAGAIEVHEVVQFGSLLERVPGNAAGWRIQPFKAANSSVEPLSLHAAVKPFTRTYWASRSEGRPLG